VKSFPAFLKWVAKISLLNLPANFHAYFSSHFSQQLTNIFQELMLCFSKAGGKDK
jgi:hypothetical protein